MLAPPGLPSVHPPRHRAIVLPATPDSPISPPPVTPVDRGIDVVVALLLLAGVTLFVVGRRALAALAAGTYGAPAEGVTWVSRAELHDLQTQWGRWLVAAGLAAALYSALRHRRRTRRR